MHNSSHWLGADLSGRPPASILGAPRVAVAAAGAAQDWRSLAKSRPLERRNRDL